MTEDFNKYISFFEKLPDPVACIEIIKDSHENPIDFVYKDVNLAYAKITGLNKNSIIGEKAKNLLTDIENDKEFDWIDIYGID